MRSTTAEQSRNSWNGTGLGPLLRASRALGIGVVVLGLAASPAVMAQDAEPDNGAVDGAVDVDFSWFVGAFKSAFGNTGNADDGDAVIPASGEADGVAIAPAIDAADTAAIAAPEPTVVPAGLAEEVQILLSDLGYDVGAIDGIVGPTTKHALEQFQRNQGLPVDGELSVELLTQLQAVQATAEVQDSAPDAIIVASAPASNPDETPLLEEDPVEEIMHRVSRFEVVGVPLGAGLGTVRRIRPFDQRGTLETEGLLARARFGAADGDILRQLDIRFGPDQRAVWIELAQGNFAIEAIPQLVTSLCERYGATDGCIESAADFQCLSEACKRGLVAHEMLWQDDERRELRAVFFTGGSETVVKLTLTLSDHGALQRLNDLAAQTPVERPGAEKLKL